MCSSDLDSNKILIQQIAIQKLECERLEKKINEEIQWQASDSGKEVYLPQVDKFHKEILFRDWEAQIKHVEKATVKTSMLSNEIIAYVCEQLVKAELLKENTSEVFSEEKHIEAQWKQKAETQNEVIKKVNKFDQENYWNFLIKPYH